MNVIARKNSCFSLLLHSLLHCITFHTVTAVFLAITFTTITFHTVTAVFPCYYIHYYIVLHSLWLQLFSLLLHSLLLQLFFLAITFIFVTAVFPCYYIHYGYSCCSLLLHSLLLQLFFLAITFITITLLTVTAEDISVKREAEEKKRLEIIQTFRNAPFEEIVARAEAKVW